MMNLRMNPLSPMRQRFAAVLGSAVLLSATGCHVNNPDAPTPTTAAAQALSELKSLPSLEETKTQVQAAIDEIVYAASRLAPQAEWITQDNAGSDNCQRPYEQTDGQRAFLPNRIAENARLTEPQWTEILQSATAAAAKLGATDIQAMHDEPGNHDVGFYGPAGLFIKVGYQGNLGVSGYTGCRLPQAKR